VYTNILDTMIDRSERTRPHTYNHSRSSFSTFARYY